MDLFPVVLNDDMPDENEFNDIFNGWTGMQSPGTSPKREDDGTSRPGSPGRPAASHGRHSPLSDDGNARVSVIKISKKIFYIYKYNQKH